MAKNSWDKMNERAKEKESKHVLEKKWTNRITRIIILVSLVIILFLAGYLFYYVTNSLKAVNPNSQEIVEVTIPFDSSSDDLSEILEDNGVIRNASVFSYYLKANNDIALQAGHYEFSPSMTSEEILVRIQEGGEPIFVDVDTTVIVREGISIQAIAKEVSENTAITEEEFLEAVQDEDFIRRLESQFPSLLNGILDKEDLNYILEGYLFPATYDYLAGMTAEDLIREMIATANLNYQALTDDLVNTYLDYHQVLTLASLIENEAITEEDRGLVSSVFYNRLDIAMPLQTDVSILYALNEHKEFVTYDDLEVDSPYNTYMYTGLPPGPVSTPSYMSIVAAIYPSPSDYYYFVADIDTQEVYFSSNIEEHNWLVEEYVNSRQSSEESLEIEETYEEDMAEDELIE